MFLLTFSSMVDLTCWPLSHAAEVTSTSLVIKLLVWLLQARRATCL